MSAIWTAINELCHFCKKEEHGYALKDDKGEYQPACWPCCQKRSEEQK